ncbi:hypothetical protein C5612_03600 [Pseudomonas frederiksbergensis]|uniref:Uncharacterized protein n=1 Tax=Pseudomonas frederiksbergensis TaxID=104087 RepID=A0A2S8HU83_9PSED|nr:hypothetical protein [Pseudomonas frederiksbergensis]PQP05732.1 hypothetical protein C5612_03600 [Pseudomonas frederiksbergensis]
MDQHKPTSKGTFTVKVNDGAEVETTDVDYHLFSGNSPERSGYIIGGWKNPRVSIGFPPGIKNNEKVTKEYPKDFPLPYLTWAHNGNNAVEGSIEIIFTDSQRYAKGKYTFKLKDNEQISGEFDVDIVSN